jgi:hypothetical protein
MYLKQAITKEIQFKICIYISPNTNKFYLRKDIVSFVMSVRPSVRLSARNNSAPNRWIF